MNLPSEILLPLVISLIISAVVFGGAGIIFVNAFKPGTLRLVCRWIWRAFPYALLLVGLFMLPPGASFVVAGLALIAARYTPCFKATSTPDNAHVSTSSAE